MNNCRRCCLSNLLCKPNISLLFSFYKKKRSSIKFLSVFNFSLLNNNQAPVLELLLAEQGITNHNVRLFLGIIKRRTNYIINRLNYSDQPSKILAKRDRVPKFNIYDMSSLSSIVTAAQAAATTQLESSRSSNRQ